MVGGERGAAEQKQANAPRSARPAAGNQHNSPDTPAGGGSNAAAVAPCAGQSLNHAPLGALFLSNLPPVSSLGPGTRACACVGPIAKDGYLCLSKHQVSVKSKRFPLSSSFFSGG